jgi:hypothetical protein
MLVELFPGFPRPGLSAEADEAGFYTYSRPEGKSGGHGVGWSEIPSYKFKVCQGNEGASSLLQCHSECVQAQHCVTYSHALYMLRFRPLGMKYPSLLRTWGALR